MNNPIMRLNKHLVAFVAFRMLGAFFVRTYFVPDEYWQSLEIAYRSVFGYGYETWEWRRGIRSYLYPTMFAIFYRVIDFFGLSRSYFSMTMGPKLFQSAICGYGDYGLYVASRNAFGPKAAKWTAALQLTSWLVFFMSSRTLTNTAEMCLLGMGLKYFPWREPEKLSAGYMFFAALSFCIRPTSAVLWLPFLIYHFLMSHRKADIFATAGFIGFMVIGISTALDTHMSGRTVFTMWEFVKVNFFEAVGDHYGSLPWHWYLSIGLPTALSFHVLPFVFAILQTLRKSSVGSDKWPVIASIVLYVAMLSVVSHKEHRFLAPVMPLINMLGGLWLADSLEKRKSKEEKPRKTAWILAGLFLANFPIAIFCGTMHQYAPIQVMRFLHDYVGDGPKLDSSGILFLTPCHSTPFYSHLLRNVPMQFLTCEPQQSPDEADRFFADPLNAIDLYPVEKFSHVVIFDSLLEILTRKYFADRKFTVCAKFFHSFFPDARRGRELFVLCRK
ncbi:unnamed protein product [Notodromas monacha]|uniref:Mannosyltransferase n=1 Tax=Notodromas monacha TaxID=399045 RepID=A0A7R9GHD3_9CRUS|nr:unnamed protein product [Notodromas monacha]CAG0922656.1 unnamed protein product [Notodromas monacha]